MGIVVRVDASEAGEKKGAGTSSEQRGMEGCGGLDEQK
jgi:hypothetical protein